MLCKYFLSSSVVFLFILLIVALEEQFLNLDEIKFIIFSFLDLVLASFVRNLCLTEGDNDFFLLFPSGDFII